MEIEVKDLKRVIYVFNVHDVSVITSLKFIIFPVLHRPIVVPYKTIE